MYIKITTIKFAVFFAFIAIVLAAVVFLSLKPEGFKYFSTECKIYSRENKLVYSLPGYQLCDFHPDGLAIASAPFSGKLTLTDKNDETLWSTTEFVHHDLKFTNDKMGILAITSDLTQFQNTTVRSDCISRRDLNNKILFKWCLKDHIKELELLGFNFKKFSVPPSTQFSVLTAEYEISHANSVYEIGPNSRSKTDPVFAEGNYIVNIFIPSLALLILDKNMEKIVWYKKMREFHYEGKVYAASGHDYQVTSEGHILAYFNRMKLRGTRPTPSFFSRLVEFDPYTDKVYWLYEDKPKDEFKSDLNGSVSKLSSSYVYTDTTYGGRATEITPGGTKIWTYVPETLDPKTQKPVMLIGFKPILNNGFLKSRNIISD